MEKRFLDIRDIMNEANCSIDVATKVIIKISCGDDRPILDIVNEILDGEIREFSELEALGIAGMYERNNVLRVITKDGRIWDYQSHKSQFYAAGKL